MQQQSNPSLSPSLKDEFKTALIWCVAAPVFAIWPIISLLPIVSAISAWGNPVEVLIALAFFSTGGAALLIGYGCYQLLLREGTVPAVVPDAARRKRVLLLTGYAVLWLLLFGLYSVG